MKQKLFLVSAVAHALLFNSCSGTKPIGSKQPFMKKILYFLLVVSSIAVFSSCSKSSSNPGGGTPPPPPPPTDSFYTKLNTKTNYQIIKNVDTIVLDYTEHIKKGTINFATTEFEYGVYGSSIPYIADSIFCYHGGQLIFSAKLNPLTGEIGGLNIAMDGGENYRIVIKGSAQSGGTLQVNGGSSFSIGGIPQAIATWTARPGPVITVSN